MKTFLVSVMLIVAMSVTAQKKITASLGMGLGGILESKSPLFPCANGGTPHIPIRFAAYYKQNNKLSFGLQIIGASELISTGQCSEYQATTNTEILVGENLPVINYLLRVRKSFPVRLIQPYVDLGVGISSFKYGTITSTDGDVNKSSVVFSPEIGFLAGRFNFSCIGIIGGKTPEFRGFDQAGNRNVSLISVKAQQLYFMMDYALFKF